MHSGWVARKVILLKYLVLSWMEQCTFSTRCPKKHFHHCIHIYSTMMYASRFFGVHLYTSTHHGPEVSEEHQWNSVVTNKQWNFSCEALNDSTSYFTVHLITAEPMDAIPLTDDSSQTTFIQFCSTASSATVMEKQGDEVPSGYHPGWAIFNGFEHQNCITVKQSWTLECLKEKRGSRFKQEI